eukprot:gene2089-2407_t
MAMVAVKYHMGGNAYWMPSAAAVGQEWQVDLGLEAAQRIGLKTIRTWAFNTGLPSYPGSYESAQFKGLDYVIAGAGKRGLQVVLCLTNLWVAYERGPENIASHVNYLNNLAYKDDPTVLGWDVMNEPRCPGCSASGLAAKERFLSSLQQVVKTAAPGQLTFSGTEGFFSSGDANVAYNPGAGAACEGENFRSEADIFDVVTTHMYERQMEAMGQLGWRKPTFDEYANYLYKKLQVYTAVAAEKGRELVVEEFGLSIRFHDDEERKVVFAIVANALIVAKRAGQPLKAAWFWNVAVA